MVNGKQHSVWFVPTGMNGLPQNVLLRISPCCSAADSSINSRHNNFTFSYVPGADPGVFLGGGALVSCSTSTPINHIVFFFCRIPVVLGNRRSSKEGGGGVVHPLQPPPSSAPAYSHCNRFVALSRSVNENRYVFAKW